METHHNAFLNSASHSPNSAKRFLRKRFRSFGRSRSNSAKHSLWVVFETQHNAFLWVAFETQHNAFLNSASHSPNSAERFPELNASLPELSKTLFTKAF
ncbi:hypothetical protein [Leptospira noguchii]|uniref:Uncharacterized protein n=1 Tax=Leptospira noguchii TaxID=28182 RepID=A0AAE9GD80_9LEPT|nr:hypothetical protein [Leptospira noguchii]UOG55833.1 hypothetical protein MAL03_13290 [Leptospira noguchii]